MKLTVNGVPRELPESVGTLGALLERLRSGMPVFVVSLNGVAVEPEDYATRAVAEGDSVEVFNQISGG
jgi:thiamine biosynthesis protein ThiS